MRVAVRTFLAVGALAVLLPMSGFARAERTAIEADSASIQPLIECLKETPTLGVLVLLDMSSSLVQLDRGPGTDPGDKRVAASQQAISEIYELRKALSTSARQVDVEVRFDGFGATYKQGNWIRLDSDGAVRDASTEAQQFARLDNEILTNYGLALSNVSEAVQEYKSEGCPLVLWFTDGRYDSDNARSSTYTSNEIKEITGDELCGAGGPVDLLRTEEVPLIAIGLGKSDWTDSRRENEFSLIRSVVEGVPIPPGQPLAAGFVCGSAKPLGIFEEVRDASTLVEDLVRILETAMFEGFEDPEGSGEGSGGETFNTRCVPIGERSDRCEINFVLGNYVESFSLYVKGSPSGDVEYSIIDPTGKRTALRRQSSVGSGIEASRIGSWMWIQGTNPSPSGDWRGTWRIELSNYEPEEPRVIAKLFPGEVSLAIEQPQGFNPLGEADVRVSSLFADLEMGNVPLGVAEFNDPDVVEVQLTMRVGDVEQVSTLVSEESVSEESETEALRSQLDPTDLEKLLAGAAPSAWGLEISGGEANFLVFDDDPPQYHMSEIDGQFLWFDGSPQVQFDDDSKVVDREARQSGDEQGDLVFWLTRNDVRVSNDDRFDVALDVELELGGEVVAAENGLLMASDGSFSIPESTVLEAIAGEGSQLTIRVDPTVIHTATGSSLSVQSPVTGSIGIRADSGLPVYVDHVSSNVVESDPDAPVVVTIELEPPKQGVGSLEVIGVAQQPTFIDPEYSEKTFTIGSQRGCSDIAPSEENYRCEIELDHDWRGAIDSVEGLQLEYRLSGSDLRGESPPPEVLEVKPFSMERPPDTTKFFGTLLLLLLMLTVVQLLVRAVYTSMISRWFAAPLGARHASVQITVNESDRITLSNRTRGPLQSHDLDFATDLERRDRAANVGGQQLEVNWWKTFIGEPARGRFGWLMRRQEPVVRVRYGSHYVVGSEGFDPPNASGSVGLMPIGIASAWVLRIPTTEKDALVDGQSVSGELWFVVDGDPDKSAQSQLDRLLEDLDGVGTRRMTQLRNDLKAAVEVVADDQNSVIGSDDPPPTPYVVDPVISNDPFSSNDPFGSSAPVRDSGGSADDSSSKSPPNDPFSSNDPFS